MVRNIALATMFITAPTAVNAAIIGAYVHEAVFEGTDPYGTTAVIDSCAPPDLQIPTAFCSGSGYASAYANMNTGTLTAHVSVPSSPYGASGYAGAVIYDFLKFNGYTSGQHMVITETGSGAASFENGYAALGLQLSFSQDPSSPIGTAEVFGSASTVVAFGGSGCSNPSLFPDVTVCKNSSGGSLSVSIDFPIDYITNPSNGVFMQASVNCIDNGGSITIGGTCDVTDPITITMPAGVTFTSASGQFLTAPVPVPAAVWLFGSGLLGLIGVARRKKTA
jgi:hypothetical protein